MPCNLTVQIYFFLEISLSAFPLADLDTIWDTAKFFPKGETSWQIFCNYRFLSEQKINYGFSFDDNSYPAEILCINRDNNHYP